MQPPIKKPLGVIDVLASGFELVLQNPWILFLPVLVDLFVWLGPQISIKPLAQNWLALLNTGAALPPNPSAEMQENWDMFRTMLQGAGDTFNFFGVIATGIPSLLWLNTPNAPARQVIAEIPNGTTLIAMLAPLALVGVALTALYLELIGRVVRKETGWKSFLPRVVRAFAAITLYGIALLIGMFGVMLPLSLIATVLLGVNQGIASSIVLLGTVAIIWATLYLAFALPSIIVSGANALQAIVNSARVFRFDFPAAMGLIVLTYLIHWGFGIIWQFLFDTPWGVLFDVIANAFLGSGLTAAVMIFYADRMALFNELRARMIAKAKG
jgi:hypothetical protein